MRVKFTFIRRPMILKLENGESRGKQRFRGERGGGRGRDGRSGVRRIL